MAIVESLAVHATYHKSKRNRNDDMVLVKIRHKHDDGSTSSEIKEYKNPKRPIYVTKPQHKLEVKPESIPLSKTNKYMTTQSNMFNVAKKALKYETDIYKARTMRDINNSANIFWSSLATESIVLHNLRVKKGMDSSSILPTVGAMDFEWDVDTGRVSIGSYASGDKVALVINREHFKDTPLTSESKFIDDVNKGFKEVIQPILDEYYSRDRVKKAGQVVRKFVPEVVFSDNELTTMKDTVGHARVDEIDYLTAWGGIADISTAQRVASEYGTSITDIFADPNISTEYRNSFFSEGRRGSKKDANGANKAVKLQHEWHNLINTAGFMYVDMMGVYHINRKHLPDAPSAALDWALIKELAFGKLKIDCGIQTDDVEQWHKEMSINHLVAYTLYAAMDTIGLVILEDKNFEISSTFFSGAGFSPYPEFVKNPMRLSTDMHFDALEDGLAICAVGSNMKTEQDALILPSRNITVTLNPSYNSGMAMPILSDSNDLVHIVSNAADGDLTSAYPTNQIQSNGSRGTTLTEMCGFNNIGRLKGNACGYSLMSGAHNNNTIAQVLLALPSQGELINRLNNNRGN